LYILKTEDGHSLKWFTSGGLKVDTGHGHRYAKAGDSAVIDFTVKDHSEYKGSKQTSISRASAASIEFKSEEE
jgi:hypothetical protein